MSKVETLKNLADEIIDKLNSCSYCESKIIRDGVIEPLLTVAVYLGPEQTRDVLAAILRRLAEMLELAANLEEADVEALQSIMKAGK